MKTTIDAAGRLVISKEIRDRVGLRRGMPVDVRSHDGHVEIEPAPTVVQLTRKGRFVVAVPSSTGASLTAARVERTREDVAREHGSGIQ
jgi:AbrB family looped-hinge helix DNA binding protein